MHRIVIFANGELPDINKTRTIIRGDDYIICADGGTRHAFSLDIKPALVIGDMDSADGSYLRNLQANGVVIELFPRDKNETDLELAIQHAIGLDPQELVIIAALGGRLDQTLANIALLSDPRLATFDIRLDDGVEEIFFCREQVEVHGGSGDIVSLIPWRGAVTGTRTIGLRWTLDNETLYPERTRGISNEMKRLFLLSILILVACAPQATPVPPVEPQTLTVMTHDSFAVSEDVVKAFETDNNARISFIQSGDAGAMLNKAILTKEAPLADVLYGVDNTFLSRALGAGIYEPYASAELNNIPDAFKLDPSDNAMPVDYGDVCINYDKKYFADHSLVVPQSLEELTKPEYANLLVVENPATSSTGLAFLLATVTHFGDGYLEYWRELKANGIVVVDGWETAYYTNFSASSGKGSQPMVVSYGTSPAAEVIFADPPISDAPTASIIGPDTCFRQIEFVGILKGTQHRALAEKFIDFMLGKQFQEDMPLQMFVYPVNSNAVLPEAFTKYSQAPAQTATLTPDIIAANRDKWIQKWTDAVMK